MEARTEGFERDLQVGAAAARLLSHPARMAIIAFLSKQNVCMTRNIANELPLSRTTINQHLQALKNAGWVKGTIRGARICYCLDTDVISRDTEALQQFLKTHRQGPPPDCTIDE